MKLEGNVDFTKKRSKNSHFHISISWEKILPSSPGLLPFFIQKCTALGEASTLHCNDTFEPSLVITNWS